MSESEHGSSAQSKTVRVITVHGTGDTSTGLAGEKWYQTGSAFSTKLAEHLTAAGYALECEPFLWSGANSARARARAAAVLQQKIEIAARGGRVHVIGHSHGGNVANDAACRLDWRKAAGRRKLVSVTTVGTPFLRTKVSLFEAILKWAFAVVVALGGAGALVFAVARTPEDYTWWLLPLAIVPAAAFVFRELRRMQRARRSKRMTPEIVAIRHRSDEAIAFLQHVERLGIEPFSRGSLGRATTPWAEFVGMVVTIVFIPAAWTRAFDQAKDWSEGTLDLYVTALAWLTMLAAGSFVFAYAFTRLVTQIVLEWGSRGWINGTISDILKGLALGRDGGLKVGDTSPQSHHYGTVEILLDGEVAQRMTDASTAATQRLFDKYRSSLFSVGADASNAVIEMAKDAMTWDSLIHTTYFDQPEIAELIANHIVAAEQA